MRLVGIDPGTNTGIAEWDAERMLLLNVTSTALLDAMDLVHAIHPALVVLEDARLIGGRAKRAQGAGSVKRDSSLWVQFLEREHIPYLTRRPSKRNTKWPSCLFESTTGWTRRTNSHGRDAALLVYGTTLQMAKQWVTTAREQGASPVLRYA